MPCEYYSQTSDNPAFEKQYEAVIYHNTFFNFRKGENSN